MEKLSVIKYEGDNNTLIYKYPEENFTILSELVVFENQEAIFFMNGQALDSFGPGRHILNAEKLPLITRMYKHVINGNEPFHSSLYFINKTEQMGIKWGTSSMITINDPKNGVPVSLGLSGE